MTTIHQLVRKHIRAEMRLLTLTWIVAVVGLSLSTTLGESVLYDNTDHRWQFPHSGPKNVLWIGTGGRSFPGEEYRFLSAQPFYLGGHDNISSVAIPIGLEDSTPAHGSIRVALWDSNGEGFPMQEVGQLGVIDFSTLEIAADFNQPASAADNGIELPIVTLESPVQGLAPGGTYYVVLDFDDLPVAPHGGILGLTNSAIGANGAGRHLVSPENPTLPLSNSDWIPITAFFPHGEHIQMRILSDDDPYQVVTTTVGERYVETFDAMDMNGERDSVPDGWAYFEEIVEYDVTDPSDDEIIYNTFTTDSFPLQSQLSRLSLFNAGVPGDSDRALAIGMHHGSLASTIQFVTEVTGGDVSSIQLAFDVEAWDCARSVGNAGEAAFHVAIDVDSGEGFEQALDLGIVTTGATLALPEGDFVNGNDDAYRTSFDSGPLDLNVPEGSQVRVRWTGSQEAVSRSWVFGLDNVSLASFAETVKSVFGDYNGNGIVEQADLDLVLLNWGARPTDSDLTAAGWVHNLPDALIDQQELDNVLLNWGTAAASPGAAGGIPEPSAATLLAIGLIAVCRLRSLHPRRSIDAVNHALAESLFQNTSARES